MFAQRREFRGKNETVLAGEKKQRLLAEAVAREEYLVRAAVVNRKGPHAVEPPRQLGAPMPPAMQQRFGVGVIGDEYGAELFQLRAQFLEVVDLAIEDDAQRAVGRRHRLLAAGEVEKREAAKT